MSGGDLARTLAFAFRRKGVDAMPGTQLRLLLAYDLRWFAPEDAKRAVQRAIDAGLLVEHADDVRPTFPLDIDIPLNFRPGPDVLDEALPAHAPQPAATGARQRAAEDERRRRGLLLSVEAAALIVRRRDGEDVTADAARLEAELLASGAPTRREAP